MSKIFIIVSNVQNYYHRNSDRSTIAPILNRHDLPSILAKSHLSTRNITLGSPTSEIFPPNKSCVLSPEVTEGPFCKSENELVSVALLKVVADAIGESIRQDIIENEKGVHLHLDILVLDHCTCNPITNQYVEIWSVNSTVG